MLWTAVSMESVGGQLAFVIPDGKVSVVALRPATRGAKLMANARMALASVSGAGMAGIVPSVVALHPTGVNCAVARDLVDPKRQLPKKVEH